MQFSARHPTAAGEKLTGTCLRFTLPDLAHAPIDRTTLEAIVSLARAHGLKTGAEFVGSQELREQVKALGIDYAQGYAIHRPSPF